MDTKTGSCAILRKTDHDDEIYRSCQEVKFFLKMEKARRKAFGFTEAGWWLR